MVEIGVNITISHLLGQTNSCLDVTSPLRISRNEILNHEADVTVFRDATVESLTLSQLEMKLFEQYARVLLNEDLLNQD